MTAAAPTLRRAVVALIWGATTGGALTTLGWLLVSLEWREPASVAGAAVAIQLAPLVFLLASAIYLFGLMSVGVLGWWCLHAIKLQGPRSAAVFGAGANALAIAPLAVNADQPAIYILAFAAKGAVVGLFIRRTAYRE